MATRAALGASSRQLLRQFLAESVWLVIGGTVLGVAVARVGVEFLLTRVPTDLPRADEVGLDLRVLAVTKDAAQVVVAATPGVALLAAFLPARRAASIEPTRALQDQ